MFKRPKSRAGQLLALVLQLAALALTMYTLWLLSRR